MRQGYIIQLDATVFEGKSFKYFLIVSNPKFFKYTGHVKVVPIVADAKDFPLHIDYFGGISGKVLLEYEHSLDLSDRTFETVDKVSGKFLKKVLDMLELTY